MKKSLLFITTILLAIGVLSACSSEAKDKEKPKEGATVETEKASGLQLVGNETVGDYLADAKGMALYVFTKDEKDVSNCKEDCLEKWPVFYEQNIEVPEGFDKNDFGEISREDTNEKQTTYKGHPLYYFFNDKVKGDTNGQGVKDVWFIVNAETK